MNSIVNNENKMTDKELKVLYDSIRDESSKYDSIDDITEEQMKDVPTEVVAETDQDVVIGSKVGEMPKVMKLKESDSDIIEVLDGKTEDEDALKALAIEGAENDLGLTEDEAVSFGEAVLRYRAGEDFNYYGALPNKLKLMVDQLAASVQLPKTQRNHIVAQLFDEFINDHELEDIFVDFDKSIKQAMQLPSAEDMYLENMRDVMTNKLQEMADTIRAEDSEKADTLIKIKNAYIESTTFERLIKAYNESGRVRKAVRRDVDKVNRYLDEYNFRNNKTIFKMSDANVMMLALKKVLIEDKRMLIFVESEEENVEQDYTDLDITEQDIAKFLILFCKTSENLDPHNIVDAAYMYYGMKNIIMLMHTEETKTAFAGELISNIVNVIKLIRNKEEEYNGDNLSKSSRGRKVSPRK